MDRVLSIVRSYLSAPQVVCEALDEEAVLESARPEFLAGLVSYQVSNTSPSDQFPLLRQIFREEFFRNGGYVADLTELDEVLSSHQLPVIVLKGASLIFTAYQGVLGIRFLSDIDLLVRAADYEKVGQILRQELGYQSSDSINFRRDGRAIDLHQDPMTFSHFARSQRVTDAFRFEEKAVWSRSVPLAPDRFTILRRMGPEDQFLQLAVHALKHAYSRLHWLVDLALCYREIDPVLLSQASKQLHCHRILAYTNHLLHRFFDFSPPPLGRLPSLNWIERAFLDRVIERRQSETMGKLVVVFSIPGWWARLGYLYRFLMPQSDHHDWRTRLVQLGQLARDLLRSVLAV